MTVANMRIFLKLLENSSLCHFSFLTCYQIIYMTMATIIINIIIIVIIIVIKMVPQFCTAHPVLRIKIT